MRIYRHLNATKERGLHYWRRKSNDNLPKAELPFSEIEECVFELVKEHSEYDKAYVLVDSDWAGNIKIRRSISGMAIILTGAAVVYKTILH